MQPLSRHQCLIYSGSAALHLPALAALMRRKLEEPPRCLYLDSPPMVAGMRSYLAKYPNPNWAWPWSRTFSSHWPLGYTYFVMPPLPGPRWK